MNKYSSEISKTHITLTCFVCGQDIVPALARCIFRKDGSMGLLYTAGWSHINCEPKNLCTSCRHYDGDWCNNEFAVFADGEPRCMGCVKWEARDIRLTCVQCKIRYTHIPTLKYTTRELCAVCADLSRKGKAMAAIPMNIYFEPPVNGHYVMYSDLTVCEVRRVAGIVSAVDIAGPIIEFRIDKRHKCTDITSALIRMADAKAKPPKKGKWPDPDIAIYSYVPLFCGGCGAQFHWEAGDRNDYKAGLTQGCNTCGRSFMYVKRSRVLALAYTQPGDSKETW